MPEQTGAHLFLGIVLTNNLSILKVGGCEMLNRLEIGGFIFNQTEWIGDNYGQ